MYEALITLKRSHQMGIPRGVVSVCSAHPFVLKTAMQMAGSENQPLLIEATAGQVNQFGGYTGMTPAQFAASVYQLALSAGLSKNQFMIGADHLGPHVWKHEPSETALQKAEELIRQCVSAGFEKIHLDTAVGCLDDPVVLPLELIIKRAARLCRVAENMNIANLLYVIGNEVPTPGGGLETEQELLITNPAQLLSVLEQYKNAFCDLGLQDAFSRVIAVVVQPGVDFGDKNVSVYQSENASELSRAHDILPGFMTFEIHSTDYQPADALKQMVDDHFSILKVGPCLTFALQRMLFSLSLIEDGLPDIKAPSNLVQVMDRLMGDYPAHWQKFYKGTETEIKKLRHNSLRDRIRYYWPFAEAQQAVNALMKNLHRSMPADLWQRHLGCRYPDLAPDYDHFDPEIVLTHAIKTALQPYFQASRNS